MTHMEVAGGYVKQNGSYEGGPWPRDGTECSETSAYKIQTPGNYPEENIKHTEHIESLKSRMVIISSYMLCRRNCGVLFVMKMQLSCALIVIMISTAKAAFPKVMKNGNSSITGMCLSHQKK
jgi:hypothetical protein